MPTSAKSSSVQDFARIAQNIEASVLGRLMHGQRELFQRNLLAWFFELPALEGAAERVFRPLTRPGEEEKRKAHRDLQHLDLVFKWPDCAPLVVENRVFAIPRQTQLAEYAITVAAWPGSPTALVVLPTGKPSSEVPGWRYLSYEELANSIEQSLPTEHVLRHHYTRRQPMTPTTREAQRAELDKAIWRIVNDNGVREIRSARYLRAGILRGDANCSRFYRVEEFGYHSSTSARWRCDRLG